MYLYLYKNTFKRTYIFVLIYMRIAIIETNDIHYDINTDIVHANFTHDKIDDIMSEYVELINITSKDALMETIVTEISGKDYANQDLTIHTSLVENTDNNLYMMCHFNLSEISYPEFKKRKIPQNGIASYLSDNKMRVYGKTVLFKMDTCANTNDIVSITMDEIIDLFINKFIHKGVIIFDDKTDLCTYKVEEFKYVFNPIDWMSPNDVQNFKYHEIEILGKILMIFFDASDTILNTTVSQMSGKEIYGKAYVGIRSQYTDITENDITYENIDIPIAHKIIKLCSDPLLNKQLSMNEYVSNNLTLDMTSSKTYNNFTQLLSKRLNIVQS